MLTREELALLRAKSELTFGSATHAEKLLKKGELVESVELTSSGAAVKMKRWKPVTFDEILLTMEMKLKQREEEAKKAMEEQEKKETESSQGEVK